MKATGLPDAGWGRGTVWKGAWEGEGGSEGEGCRAQGKGAVAWARGHWCGCGGTTQDLLYTNSTNQLTRQPTNQPTNPPTNQLHSSTVHDRVGRRHEFRVAMHPAHQPKIQQPTKPTNPPTHQPTNQQPTKPTKPTNQPSNNPPAKCMHAYRQSPCLTSYMVMHLTCIATSLTRMAMH